MIHEIIVIVQQATESIDNDLPLAHTGDEPCWCNNNLPRTAEGRIALNHHIILLAVVGSDSLRPTSPPVNFHLHLHPPRNPSYSCSFTNTQRAAHVFGTFHQKDRSGILLLLLFLP